MGKFGRGKIDTRPAIARSNTHFRDSEIRGTIHNNTVADHDNRLKQKILYAYTS